ncbi:hypothetical protein E2C01_098133 [Portunus trituberculatus]|uniref:Uncharacterized protein n=1 Tax=Portunus trituberculatus TaxID=210409 RepID=A0A5B7K7G5_PORTR|nr:hypothetical protein [Portunus trituberculatus]
MLTNIWMAFQYLDKDEYDTFKVGICSSDVVAELKKNIRRLEQIQRIATKMVPELKDLTYEERLKEMDCLPYKIEEKEETQ